MSRFTASPFISGCFNISEIDADGIGRRRYFVGEDKPTYGTGKLAGEDIARLVVLALSLPDGIEGAIRVLRAELAKHA